MSKCLGCGIKLQNADSNIEGYVSNIDKKCFDILKRNGISVKGVVDMGDAL